MHVRPVWHSRQAPCMLIKPVHLEPLPGPPSCNLQQAEHLEPSAEPTIAAATGT